MQRSCQNKMQEDLPNLKTMWCALRSFLQAALALLRDLFLSCRHGPDAGDDTAKHQSMMALAAASVMRENGNEETDWLVEKTYVYDETFLDDW